MSKYTTQLRWICSSLSNNTRVNGNNYEDIIETSRPKIFNFKYPIFDEKYKPILETKIIKHYFFREIGQETFPMFQMYLNQKMNELMPYYNKLYESELLKFNPLYTDDIKTTHNRNENVENTGKIISQGESTIDKNIDEKNKFSDTPQGSINNLDDLGYLTNYTHINSDENSTENTSGKVDSNDNSNTTENYLETIQGYRGYSANKLLKEFRDNFLNIDLMIIDEISDLFFYLID